MQIRNLSSEDLGQVQALHEAYARANHGATVVPAPVYVSPGFDGGKRVFCAFDEAGKLVGMAPIFPNLAQEPGDEPHRIWVDIKAAPGHPEGSLIRQELLERLEDCTAEIVKVLPPRPAQIVFQYFPFEKEAAAFVTSRGYTHKASVFQMGRDLSEPIPDPPCPEGVEIRAWRMESEAEQRRYIAARNDCFPHNLVSLEDWQYFMQSPHWAAGTCLAAFDCEALVGSAAIYWDPAQEPENGARLGYTEHIFVLPKWRGRGLARCLVARGMAYLHEHGLQQARLEVSALNESALGLYTGLGYRVIRESWFLEKTLSLSERAQEESVTAG